MDYIQVVFMAIVQGIAEFLPISSSGHLCVLYDLFKQLGTTLESSSLTLSIALHFGTLISIFVVYRARIWKFLTTERRVLLMVLIATIPAALAKTMIDDSVLENSLVAGICFPITGIMLLWCSDRSGNTTCREMSVKQSALIGLVQAIALLPGISRSGSTICAGLLCGMKRDEAATFSFMMAIPAIAGGALLETIELLKNQSSGTAEPISQHGIFLLLIGVIVSCVVGILALKLLLKWLEQGKLKYFAYWLFLLGPTVIIWRLFFA
jgi:Uncharacterized bacitracin resistance protein